MSLPVLKINFNELNSNLGGTLGFSYIVGALKESKLFEIQEHNETIKTAKGFRATILYFNGRKIYLDFWEYSAPTHNTEILNANFDLIIKLQHKIIKDEEYIRFIRHKKMFVGVKDSIMIEFLSKIVPWTFFPSKNMMPYIGREQDLISLPIGQLGFFCGRNWKARHTMKAALDQAGIKYICNEVEGQRISDEEFMRLMLSSQYGIVLPGRSTAVSDSKNRREIDYMMMRKPLMISYKPYYYDPLVEGKHYIYINEKTNFKSLTDMYNIKDMVENAFQWYQRNATPSGIASSFLKIMSDKGYIENGYTRI